MDVNDLNMENIHERVLHLKDVALGLRKSVQVNSALTPASYDCAVDSLLALYTECSNVTSLAKDKHIARFLGKCKARICTSGCKRSRCRLCVKVLYIIYVYLVAA